MKALMVSMGLLLVSVDSQAAMKRLNTDCAIPGGFGASEATPVDLDWCSLSEGDDITELLKDIGNAYGAVYVRAPSKTMSVVAETTQWVSAIPGKPIKTFVFLEDQNAANKFTINHYVPNIYDTFTIAYEGTTYKGATLWTFQDHVYVKIGGPNLTLTLVGTHPGLGTGDYITTPYADPTPKYKENVGFIEARMVNGSSPDLLDVRANIRFTHRYSIYTFNGQGTEPAPGSTPYRIKQLNVAGVHYATSGVFFHQGVQKAWADPDRFVVTDPYVRMFGWTGEASSSTEAGRTIGCVDQSRDQVRMVAFAGYLFDEMLGGVTVEYGFSGIGPRFAGRIGTSANDPFIIRMKDMGMSGPGTPYPAGLRVKLTTEGNFTKGDPNDAFGEINPARFVRYVRLPPTYADGPASDGALGCSIDNYWGGGYGNLVRIENNVPGRASRGWHIEFSGDWVTNYARTIGRLFLFGHVVEATHPVYNNTLRLADGTTLPDTIVLYDRNTVTGPGTFTNLLVSDLNATNQGKDSVITNTTVAGVVTIDAGTERTTVMNVRFTGSPRPVITIGSGSTVNVSKLCVPNGSTITGSGLLTYDGINRALPFTITATNGCSLSGFEKPQPPELLDVS